MSGRIKQRTKGNTKPSSSGRAAELLSRDGVTAFVGFGDTGVSPDGSSLQFVPASTEHPEASVHSDFLVVMKKLSKRDAVTKLKAVQEFGELCKTSDMKAVLGVLKYWPRLYNKLALDIDYRVREATQHALNQVTSRVGRNFAPHLKNVMGTWLCCQCDSYQPVATGAQKAFNLAFSENKQAEVLAFCKNEIHEYLKDNLMNQTADTLSDPDVIDEEDRGAKYVRVVSASLQALGRFLNMTDEDVHCQVARYHTSLTAEKKFWKLGRHKSPQIRAAFFSLISTYCKRQPDIIKSCSSLVCPIVLGSLDEADAIVSVPLWEAVLQVVTTVKDCWRHLNMEKAVLPKFWHFLSNAAYGNAHVVMISVLPFISMLPDKVMCPSTRFAEELFEKIIDGLKLVKTQQSPSECKAVLSSFMDCVKYFMSFGSRNWKIEIDQNSIEHLRTHVINMLISVIEMSLGVKTQMRQCSSSLYERLADFLQDTNKNADMLHNFWDVFDKLVQDKILCSETDMPQIVNLLLCLKSKQSPQVCQPSKVRFSEPSSRENQFSGSKIKTKKHDNISDVDVNFLYGGRLLTTVNDVVCSCLKRVWLNNSVNDLILVTELIRGFFSVCILNNILTIVKSFSTEDDFVQTDISKDSSLSHDCVRCINALVLPLLGNSRQKINEKWLFSTIQLLFVFLLKTEEREQKCAFERVFQINSSPDLLYFIVNEIFEADYHLHLSYLHGIQIGTKMVEALKKSPSNVDKESAESSSKSYLWKSLELCFLNSNLLEFFFNENMTSEIFQVFHLVLSHENVEMSKIISVAQLIEKYINNNEITSSQYERMINKIFMDILHLKLNGQVENHLSQCWNSLINTALSDISWTNMVLSQTAQQIKDFLSINDPIAYEKFSVFTDAALEIFDSLSKDDSENFRKLLMKLLPSDLDWSRLRDDTLSKSTWAVIPLLDGRLSFTQFPKTSCLKDVEHLTSHQMLCLFLSHVLKQRYSALNFTEDDYGDNYEWTMLTEMLWLREHNKQTAVSKNERLFQTILSVMDTNLQPLLSVLNEMSGAPIVRRLLQKSKSEGGLWSLSLKTAMTAGSKDEAMQYVLIDFMVCEEENYSEQKLQTLQCLLGVETSIDNLAGTVEKYSHILETIYGSNGRAMMFCYCVLSSALERWIDLSQDSNVALLECQSILHQVLKGIKARQETMTDQLLFSCCLDNVELSVISLNLAIASIMTLAVRNVSEKMESELWDMILCSMLDWLQSCQDSNVANIRVIAMTSHVCQLIEVVAKNLSQAVTSNSTQDIVDAPSTDDIGQELLKKLSNEWQEFFSVSASDNLLRLWSRIVDIDNSQDRQLSVAHHRLSETLSAACCYLTVDNLKQYITSCTSVKISESLNWPEDFFRKYMQYMESSYSAFQLTAYRLLMKVIPLFETPKEEDQPSEDDQDEPYRSPPTQLIRLITETQSRLSSILSEAEVPFGETLDMEDDHEASHITRVYLLSWKLLLQHFANSNEELRAGYANYLRGKKYLNELLEKLFRILPRKPREWKCLVEQSSLEEKYLLGDEFVHTLAYETYCDLLRTLPALVRQWWNNLEKKYALVVEKYTTSYISPLLCDKELQTIQKTTSTYENMEIVTRSSSREVIALYKIEDISIELIVSLSSSYPLGPVNVTCGKRVGVKLNQWRLWMMQLTTFLMHQNGTILDGLLLWKRNVDKKFEGVDDCMICFSVIHGSNYSLPSLSCKTCKKKFHSACLYRWFNTSNNSTCPLCRNLF